MTTKTKETIGPQLFPIVTKNHNRRSILLQIMRTNVILEASLSSGKTKLTLKFSRKQRHEKQPGTLVIWLFETEIKKQNISDNIYKFMSLQST